MNLINSLLKEINAALLHRNGPDLYSLLPIEPPFTPAYAQLVDLLRSSYSTSDHTSSARLEGLVKQVVTETAESEDEEGRPVQAWSGMVGFLGGWMAFLRDLDMRDLGATFDGLAELMGKANSALEHPTKGILMLPPLVQYARVFARVAVGLDKNPSLVERPMAINGSTSGSSRESFSEKAANLVRKAFLSCLHDKKSAPGGIRNGRPDGKKAGIYRMANTCLRILFQADKLDNCTTIFRNISASAPPLHFYPAAERVTYLYYLGRFLFASSEYYRASLVLQKAYDECAAHASVLKQRRLILIHLVTANILLGRFPTEALYTRPEARDIRVIFTPITSAIRRGDLESWRRISNFELTYEHAQWLMRYGLFYPLTAYCEPLVHRSLLRTVFLLTGAKGAAERAAPTLDLRAALLAVAYCEQRALMTPAMAAAQGKGPGRRHVTFAIQDPGSMPTTPYIDPDFVSPSLPPSSLPPAYVPSSPTLEQVECQAATLITQGLLNGYLSHKLSKFAVQGVKTVGGGNAAKAGWPRVWDVLQATNRAAGADEVEGWVRDERRGGGGGGRTVRLSGARAAGS